MFHDRHSAGCASCWGYLLYCPAVHHDGFDEYVPISEVLGDKWCITPWPFEMGITYEGFTADLVAKQVIAELYEKTPAFVWIASPAGAHREVPA